MLFIFQQCSQFFDISVFENPYAHCILYALDFLFNFLEVFDVQRKQDSFHRQAGGSYVLKMLLCAGILSPQ